ncbi:MAG: ATP-binding protein [Chthoniobacterales bacterium]
MTFSLRNTPIKRKLTLLILLTTSFALVFMGSALIAYEVITFRRTLAANMTVLAQIVGSNTTAALAFEDPKNAQEVLSALSAERQITAAAIYDDAGKIFARFPQDAADRVIPPAPAREGYAFHGASLDMFQSISQQEGGRLGTIFLRADLGAMYKRIAVYAGLLLFVGIASFLGALMLASTLQRGVSHPILELAKVAQAVSERQDYSVRGNKYGEDEIGKLTDAFNQMLERIGKTTEDLSAAKESAEAANKAKDDFLAVLSHELRTPLTPVLTTIAMMKEDQSNPPQTVQDLEIIRRNVEVEARLIDDLLDLTGILRGKLELRREPVDVGSLLEHAMQNYCNQHAAQKNLKLSVEISATERGVLADSARMTQVFWNLLQNACKFTPAGGAIDVRVSNDTPPGRPVADLVVEITDTGIGISKEAMPRIFEAFEQGERSRGRVFGGLGLGLAITRAIVELHGGTITATSAGEGKGTRMTIRLPTTAAAPATAVIFGQPTSAPKTDNGPSLRVLLVEDHPDTAEQLRRLLQRAGHDVACASNLKEALACSHRTNFDILISDLGLPDGSGYDLMRDVARNQHIPGIALSGFGMKEDVANSLAAGFSRHFTKPVNWPELQNEILKLAHRS